MLEELKRNAALSNFAALNSNVDQNDTANQAKAVQLHAEVTILQQQLIAQQVCLTDAQQSLPYACPFCSEGIYCMTHGHLQAQARPNDSQPG